jgi:hypothetical protein
MDLNPADNHSSPKEMINDFRVLLYMSLQRRKKISSHDPFELKINNFTIDKFKKFIQNKSKSDLEIIKKLYIQHSVFPKQILDYFPNLTSAFLNNNQLSKLIINNTHPDLVLLQLENNNLTEIEFLKNCPNLNYLNLAKNKLTNLKNTPLNTLTNLRVLDISDNPLIIENIPKQLLYFSKLRIIGFHSVYVPKYYSFRIHSNLSKVNILLPKNKYLCQPFSKFPNTNNIIRKTTPIQWQKLIQTPIGGLIDSFSTPLQKNIQALLDSLFPNTTPITIQNKKYSIYQIQFIGWKILTTTTTTTTTTTLPTSNQINWNNLVSSNTVPETPKEKLNILNFLGISPNPLPFQGPPPLINPFTPVQPTTELTFQIEAKITLFEGEKINWYNLPTIWCSNHGA